MSNKPLSPDQIAHFKESGYVVLNDAFDPGAADDLIPLLFAEWGIDPHDRSTWQKAEKNRILITHTFTEGRLAHLFTQHLTHAVDQLCGQGRWQHSDGTGYVLASLPGYEPPPWEPLGNGHVDGNHFHHHLTSPNQSLVIVFHYTQVERGGGGTWISQGSHKIVARHLAESEPDGLSCADLAAYAREHTAHLPIVEITCEPGSVLLMHPFAFHGSSKNCNNAIRVASNMCIWLGEPMRMCRPSPNNYSTVEQTIREALMESTDTHTICDR